MKAVRGKLLKKIKSIKPIGYLKQDRVLHVNAADGFLDFAPKSPNIKSHQQQPLFVCKEADRESIKENIVVVQEPDVIDVSELMRDLEEEEEEEEENLMELDDDNINDKENIRPILKPKEEENTMKLETASRKQVPLAEIDISSFRRPDMNSCSLFDPNLLAAFEAAVKAHIRIGEAERRARTEGQNLEQPREEAERNSRIEEQEENLEMSVIERPRKARRVEEQEEEQEQEDNNPLLVFEEKCPPGGDGSVIIYTTTLRGIRKTFEDCNSIKFLLESFRVLYYERDVSMHMEYKEELWGVLGAKAVPPRLFIKGRYIGGAEEVSMLHEQGKLRMLFEGIPIDDKSNGPCGGCAGVRFVLCFKCNGSHRIVGEDGLSSICQECNENGLIICPICS